MTQPREMNLKVLGDALELLREFIEDCGGCDHSVGVCICGERELLNEATAALQSLVSCDRDKRDPLGEALNSGDGSYRP